MDHQHLSPLLSQGELAPVPKVAKNCTGKRCSPSTAWRHIKKGLRGGKIKLEAAFVSGRWMTTEAAYAAFVQAQTAAALSVSQSPKKSQPDADALRKLGLL